MNFTMMKLMRYCLLLMLKGAHGFMKTHKWHDTIGAFINVEASGTGGPGKCDAKFLLLVVGQLTNLQHLCPSTYDVCYTGHFH